MCYWPLIAVIIPHFIYILKEKSYAVRANFLSTVLAASFALFTSLFLFNILPQHWILSLPLIFSTVYLIGTAQVAVVNRHWQQPFQRIGELGVVAVSLILTYSASWNISDFWVPDRQSDVMTWGYIIAAVLLSVVVLLLAQAVKENARGKILLGVAPVVALAGVALRPGAVILCNIYFLIICLDRIQRGIKENKLRIINEGLLLLAIIIAVRFFDSQIDMVLKGLVLIILGAGFLAANVVFLRRKGGSHE